MTIEGRDTLSGRASIISEVNVRSERSALSRESSSLSLCEYNARSLARTWSILMLNEVYFSARSFTQRFLIRIINDPANINGRHRVAFSHVVVQPLPLGSRISKVRVGGCVSSEALFNYITRLLTRSKL